MKKIAQIIKKFWFASLSIYIISLSAFGYLSYRFPILQSHFLNGMGYLLLTAVSLALILGLFLLSANRIHYRSSKPTLKSQLTEQEVTKKTIKALKKSITKILKKVSSNVFFIWRKPTSVYRLPWYLVIGKESSGKTSLLATQTSTNLSDIDSSAVCQWSVTEKALFIDVDGKYITQNSEELETHRVWQCLLRCLKRYRYWKPINGIIIAINITLLLQQSAQQNGNDAEIIYQRLQEVYREFGLHVPVHLVLTHCDQLAGFKEFYQHSEVQYHASSLGFSIALDPKEDLLVLFSEGYNNLLKNLNQQRLQKLHHTTELDQTSLIQNFPLQIAFLKNSLALFLEQLLNKEPYSQTILLRNVYFVSSVQQGNIFDYSSNQVASAFNFMPVAAQTQTPSNSHYFTRDILSNLIIADANLHHLNQHQSQRKQWWRGLRYTFVAIIISGIIFAWNQSFQQNHQKLLLLSKQIKMDQVTQRQLAIGSIKSKPLFQELNSLAAINNVYQPQRDRLGEHWGLYPGSAIHAATSKLYQQQLLNTFLPFLEQQAQQALQQLPSDKLELYNNLAVYLMLANPRYLQPKQIEAWFHLYWQQKYGNALELRSNLTQYLDALLAIKQLPPRQLPAKKFHNYKLNNDLVAKARAQLSQLTPAEYSYLKLQQVMENQNSQALHLSNGLDSNFNLVFGDKIWKRSISSLYTKSGYLYFQKHPFNFNNSAAIVAWVLGRSDLAVIGDQQTLELKAQISQIYLQDYNDQWQQLLSHININKFTTVQQADQAVAFLANDRSPLLSLLKTIKQNTQIGSSNNNVTLQFSKVNALTAQQGRDKKMAIDPVMANLKQLQIYLQSISQADNPNEAAFQQAVKVMQGSQPESFTKLLQQAQQLPQPLQRWVVEIVQNSWQAILASANEYINQAWQQQIVPVYHKNIAGRFPFATRETNNSSQQVSFNAFSQFFSTHGVLANFINNYLKPFMDNNVDSTTGKLQLKNRLNSTLPISTQALNKLQHLVAIQKLFFSGQDQNPQFNFSLQPYYLSNHAASASIALTEETITYRHGPQQVTQISWPGRNPQPVANLTVANLDNHSHTLTAQGPWALFKLMDQAKVTTSANQGEVKVEFKVDGKRVSYLLQSKSSANPFEFGFFSNTELPHQL